MSDNGLRSLKPRKGDVSDLLSEHVTCSGVQLRVFTRRGAVVCDYACLMFGCCTCFKCHGWFTAASNIILRCLLSFCSAGSSRADGDGVNVS